MVTLLSGSAETIPNSSDDRRLWIDGEHLEKQEMTAKTGRIQARLARYWGNYKDTSGQGGEVYTETACRTVDQQPRLPNVAYLPPELVTQYGDFKILPRSFPLIAEIISPNDVMEQVFAKVNEYLTAQAEEIWLILPESRWVLVITTQTQILYSPLGNNATTVKTSKILPGFEISLTDLLA